MEKTCTKCGCTKPIEEFYKDKQKPDGHRPDCKACNNETSHGWVKKNRDKHFGYELKRKYGITYADYQKMLVDQKGKCAICGRDHSEFQKRFHVDHNHATGKVRALLCVNCNHGIGAFMENKELLKKAVQYLER
jgi:hypothetical protein